MTEEEEEVLNVPNPILEGVVVVVAEAEALSGGGTETGESWGWECAVVSEEMTPLLLTKLSLLGLRIISLAAAAALGRHSSK